MSLLWVYAKVIVDWIVGYIIVNIAIIQFKAMYKECVDGCKDIKKEWQRGKRRLQAAKAKYDDAVRNR